MFKLATNPSYWWPVRFSLPSSEQPGTRTEHGFEVQFKRLDTHEHDAVMQETASQGLTDPAFCKRVVSSFRHVIDERDVEVAFTEQAFDQLLKVPHVASAIAKAYFESRIDAAQKNSWGPLEPLSSAAPNSTTAS